MYKPIGDPTEFLAHVTQMVSARAMLASPRCDTPEREAQGCQLLSLATGKALEVLAGETLAPIGMITAVARLVREMEPAEFDAWVDLQFSGGYHLGFVAVARNPLDRAREQPIEDHLERGELAAGDYLPVLNHLKCFVGILRVKFEAELGAKTVDTQMELDLALDAYLTARRFRLAALSLDEPTPKLANVMKSLKLREQERVYDKIFRTVIDRMRTRVKRESRKVVAAAPAPSVDIHVRAATAESPGGEAASA